MKSWKSLIESGSDGSRLLKKMVNVGFYCTGLVEEHPNFCSLSCDGIEVHVEEKEDAGSSNIPNITTEPGQFIPKVSNRNQLHIGFHTPPFNSIDHIHLHIIDKSRQKPGFINWIKYHPLAFWFKSVDSVIREGNKTNWSKKIK